MRYEIRLAGAGGQGLVLAGIILAEAGLAESHHVVHSQNYGPEARGGNSVSEIIFADEDIDYPKATGLDLLVALNQKACSENLPHMKEDGLVIVDSAAVKKALWGKVIRHPLQREADVTFSDSRLVNVIALGLLTPFCSWIREKSMEQAIASMFPEHLVEHNTKAYQTGVKKGRELRTTTSFHEHEDAIEV